MDTTTPQSPSTPDPAAAKPMDSNDKLWIVLSHLSPFLGVGIIVPLIIWLVKKDDSELVAYHAKEALNFHISVFLYALACWLAVFVLIGFVLLPVLVVVAFILAIVAAVKSANGERYRYPYILRLIK
jgi:uncharacterized Tic20 family protein